MANRSPLRILHCPYGIGGQAQQIARSERELGLDSRSIVFTHSHLTLAPDEILLHEGDSRLQIESQRWRLLRRALRDFDVIHFNFGQTIAPPRPVHALTGQPLNFPKALHRSYAQLLHLRDLPLLKRAGKGIVMTYQGDDARQGDYCKANFKITMANEVDANYYTSETDAAKRRDIAYVARYADLIYALNPDLLHVLPSQAKFLPYGSLDLRVWKPVPTFQNEHFTILHAPSHRQAKGTHYVIDAVNRLISEGFDIEFILVENMSHDEVQRVFERADLLIDQVLAGWYGGLSVELMALGKPVVCYLREDDLGFIPAAMRAELPIINAAPATLYDTLKLWLGEKRSELAARGQQGRAYVERWHDPLRIAQELKDAYEQIMQRKTSSSGS